MSQRASDARMFVPFEPLPISAGQEAEGTFRLKVVPNPEAGAPPPPPDAHGHVSADRKSAANPVVTLQRDGEKVTGIRIECICGQVIELACAY